MGRKTVHSNIHILMERVKNTLLDTLSPTSLYDYSSLMRSGLSLVNIQAITECSVYEISRHDIIEYWETDEEKTQRFGRHVAEKVYLKWYMNDYLIHIVRLKYDTGT